MLEDKVQALCSLNVGDRLSRIEEEQSINQKLLIAILVAAIGTALETIVRVISGKEKKS